jgi:ATP-binding cassette subfamily F protein 3
MVAVSHDRHFLDEITTHSLHISGAARRVTAHNMNYSTWAKKRGEQQVRLAKTVALRKEKIDTLQEYAGHGFRHAFLRFHHLLLLCFFFIFFSFFSLHNS